MYAIAGGIAGGIIIAHVSRTSDRPDSGLGVVLGIIIALALYLPALWRAWGIRLEVDRAHQSIRIRNFLRSHVVRASDLTAVDEGLETIQTGRYGRRTRVPCLSVHPHSGGRIWIQASLRNAGDTSVQTAIEGFCQDNGIQCSVTLPGTQPPSADKWEGTALGGNG
jgi:hypothetical protein